MKVIITGGAGFIGVNVALAHLRSGDEVLVIDNLSRRGSEVNKDTLFKNAGRGQLKFFNADIRNFPTIKKIFSAQRSNSLQSLLIYHLAAQVAVTTSVKNPREDFEINALGTFNILEAVRQSGLGRRAVLFFSSTNKVYGGMENEKFILKKSGWFLKNFPDGINEDYPLDFHSPYGCSKGAADQYVRDYSRIYGLKTVVFRQSCIYGVNQYGVEDQGWLVHFLIRSLIYKKPLIIYGDGYQVRDALYVDDLVRLYRLTYENIREIPGGCIFNVGGGMENAISLLDFVKLIESKTGHKIRIKFSSPRPGDQKVFISNNSKAERILGWRPSVFLRRDGFDKTLEWLIKNSDMIKKVISMDK